MNFDNSFTYTYTQIQKENELKKYSLDFILRFFIQTELKVLSIFVLFPFKTAETKMIVFRLGQNIGLEKKILFLSGAFSFNYIKNIEFVCIVITISETTKLWRVGMGSFPNSGEWRLCFSIKERKGKELELNISSLLCLLSSNENSLTS